MPAAAFSRAIVTRAGSFRCRFAIAGIRAGIVAENSAVWRSWRRRLEDRVDVLGEAHVEHLVGLVEDEHAQLSSSSVLRRR